MMHIKDVINSNSSKVFLFLLVITLLYAYPILNNDRFYIDDLGRSLWGYTKWGYNGRPLSDAIMVTLSLGYPILDLSPLPQVTSLILICVAIALYAKHSLSREANYKLVIISLLFICNPFLIENISYKYDSLPMMLSAALLFLCFAHKQKIAFNLISVFFIISSLSLYQASISIFICLSIIEFINNALNEKVETKKIYTATSIRIAQLLIGYGLYSWFIARNYVTGGYNKTHSETIFSSSSAMSDFRNNTFEFYGWVKAAVGGFPTLVIYITALTVVIGIVLCVIKLNKNTDDIMLRRIIPSAVIILSPALIIIFSCLHLSLLKYPVYSPRVFIGVGVFMLYIGVISSHVKFGMLSPVLIIIVSFIMSFSYGSSMNAQSKIDDYISMSINKDLSGLNRKVEKISVIGKMPVATQLSISTSRFPLLSSLVPIYFNNNWGWAGALLEHNGGKHQFEILPKDKISEACDFEPVIKSMDYYIYMTNDKAIINFNRNKC